jgi:hypothetical protein
MPDNTTNKMPKSFVWVAFCAFAVILAVILIHFLYQPQEQQSHDNKKTSIKQSYEITQKKEDSDQSSSLSDEKIAVKKPLAPVDDNKEEQEAMPPQPQEYISHDFTNLTKAPEEFSTENLKFTDKGFMLTDPEPGDNESPRTGVLLSPVEMFDFPSNAVAPLWLEEVPTGNDIFIEVSVSPDGDEWGMWHWIDPDEYGKGAINEFYPDGRPNPNFGYLLGCNLSWGLRQWSYVRYRVTLYADAGVDTSPLLSAFRLFYQDSTLGNGHLAEEVEKTDNPALEP